MLSTVKLLRPQNQARRQESSPPATTSVPFNYGEYQRSFVSFRNRWWLSFQECHEIAAFEEVQSEETQGLL